MILSANIMDFIQLVVNINRTTIYTCQQKIQYLNELLGRIKSAISMKNFAAEQLQNLIDTATITYNQIVSQINKKNEQMKNLNIGSLRQKLQIDLTTLQGLYTQFSRIDANKSVLQSNLIQLQNDIKKQKSLSQIDRKQLIRQRLQFNVADERAKAIQKKLNDAKTRKQLIQTSLKNLNIYINNSQSQIKQNQANILLTQQQIKKLQNKSDNLKIAYQNIEITVFRIRADIANFTLIQSQYKSTISSLQQKLNIQQQKIVPQQIDILKQMISTLAKSVPTIQNYLDNNYYKCYNIQSIITNTTKDKTIFTISLEDFKKYIQNSYLLKPDWNKLNVNTESVQLTSINIMDSSWQSVFGYSFTTISLAMTTDFSFSDDFNCLSPSNLIIYFKEYFMSQYYQNLIQFVLYFISLLVAGNAYNIITFNKITSQLRQLPIEVFYKYHILSLQANQSCQRVNYLRYIIPQFLYLSTTNVMIQQHFIKAHQVFYDNFPTFIIIQ